VGDGPAEADLLAVVVQPDHAGGVVHQPGDCLAAPALGPVGAGQVGMHGVDVDPLGIVVGLVPAWKRAPHGPDLATAQLTPLVRAQARRPRVADRWVSASTRRSAGSGNGRGTADA